MIITFYLSVVFAEGEFIAERCCYHCRLFLLKNLTYAKYDLPNRVAIKG